MEGGREGHGQVKEVSVRTGKRGSRSVSHAVSRGRSPTDSLVTSFVQDLPRAKHCAPCMGHNDEPTRHGRPRPHEDDSVLRGQQTGKQNLVCQPLRVELSWSAATPVHDVCTCVRPTPAGPKSRDRDQVARKASNVYSGPLQKLCRPCLLFVSA